MPRARSRFFDRAKGLLIALVVIGHAIEIVDARGPLRALYGAIYLFHMPAFFFVAGALLVRRSPVDELRLIASRLAPAYLLGLLLALTVSLMPVADTEFRLLPPPWTLWFLLSLATLRLASSLVRVRSFAALSLAAAGIASLVALPDELSLHRSAMLAPFFAAGLLLGSERVERRLGSIGLTGALFSLGAGIVGGLILFVLFDLPRSVLYWRDPLLDAHPHLAVALALSCGLLVSAAAMSVGLLSLVVRSGSLPLLERLGALSLVVYLGHAPLLSLARPVVREASLGGIGALLGVIALSFVGIVLPLLLFAARALVRSRPPAVR